MSFTIPFTEESVRSELCGLVLVDGLKKIDSHRVTIVHESLELRTEEVPNGLKWRVKDGCLYFLNERDSDLALVNGAMVSNGQLHLYGYIMGTEGRGAPMSMVLYERKNLGDDFSIVVSSHVDYEKVTLPLLIRSLAREGIPQECITVVVGGAPDDEEPSDEKGYRRVPVSGNLMGCTALLHLLDESCEIATPYVLLMHDTCEVSFSFANTIAQIDVGLPYDLVQGTFELGLWSRAFIHRLRQAHGLNLTAVSAYKVFGLLSELCRLSRSANSSNPLRSKDVYGSGVKRQVTEYTEFGIKKYVGGQMTGGRP